MQVIITGGAGFLGQLLTKALLESQIKFDQLVILDLTRPDNNLADGRVTYKLADLSDKSSLQSVIGSKTSIIFHLAAVVSGQAEQNFDLGWRVNVDATRNLLEVCRHTQQHIRFVFASSLAVYGGNVSAKVDDYTAVTPLSSYGAQKAIGELMVNDYSRKNFVDGRVLRLPTICVRPGRPNQAASSFVSSIIREPLNGEPAVCPVKEDFALWLSSPATVISNLLHAATLEATAFTGSRTVNLPGVRVTVGEMLESLERNSDKHTRQRVSFREDPAISRIVSTWPANIDNTRALSLGFKVDTHFNEFVQQYREYRNNSINE